MNSYHHTGNLSKLSKQRSKRQKVLANCNVLETMLSDIRLNEKAKQASDKAQAYKNNITELEQTYNNLCVELLKAEGEYNMAAQWHARATFNYAKDKLYDSIDDEPCLEEYNDLTKYKDEWTDLSPDEIMRMSDTVLDTKLHMIETLTADLARAETGLDATILSYNEHLTAQVTEQLGQLTIENNAHLDGKKALALEW